MCTDKAMQGSICLGGELLMSMLGNYCRNKGIKTSVGMVGIPNVGKSSIINSLIRGKSCFVGCTSGITRAMQEVALDSKITLVDCPGIVFTNNLKSENVPAVLKNAQLMKNGVPDALAAARSGLNDWNAGKIKFSTEPPEEKFDDPHQRY